VSDLSDRLRASLAGRYAIEKELGLSFIWRAMNVTTAWLL
jgi:hypothetical protein